MDKAKEDKQSGLIIDFTVLRLRREVAGQAEVLDHGGGAYTLVGACGSVLGTVDPFLMVFCTTLDVMVEPHPSYERAFWEGIATRHLEQSGAMALWEGLGFVFDPCPTLLSCRSISHPEISFPAYCWGVTYTLNDLSEVTQVLDAIACVEQVIWFPEFSDGGGSKDFKPGEPT